jgi:hypothetical protein
MWEKSRSIDDSFTTVNRNLGWAYYRKHSDILKAITSYEKAIGCNNSDPRLYVRIG